MKHLNPRQGITTYADCVARAVNVDDRVKHLNPRQGITTIDEATEDYRVVLECETPKSPPGDYNYRDARAVEFGQLHRVKHLNPRQGITTVCGGTFR